MEIRRFDITMPIFIEEKGMNEILKKALEEAKEALNNEQNDIKNNIIFGSGTWKRLYFKHTS